MRQTPQREVGFDPSGSMAVNQAGRVHVLVRGENGSSAFFQRDPATVVDYRVEN